MNSKINEMEREMEKLDSLSYENFLRNYLSKKYNFTEEEIEELIQSKKEGINIWMMINQKKRLKLLKPLKKNTKKN